MSGNLQITSELNTNISPSVSFRISFAKPIGPAKKLWILILKN
jgi:hypothetical protein